MEKSGMNNIGHILARRAFLNPDREAFVSSKSGKRLTFSELNAGSNQIANALLERGVKPGDRVALLLANGAEFMECYFAIGKIGGVVVPLNWRLVPDELEFILKDSGSQTLVFGQEFQDTVVELHSRRDIGTTSWIEVSSTAENTPFAENYQQIQQSSASSEPALAAGDDDNLYIMYTSGTTGLPKGVVHTHNTSLWAILTVNVTSDLRDKDRALVALPMFHVGSLTPLTLNVYRGITSVVMDEFDPLRAWQLIEEEKIQHGLLVPAMLNFMLQVGSLDRFDYSTLRWVWSGASPLPINLITRYQELGIPVHQIYGLTESCGPACVITSDNFHRKLGSTGNAFFHTEIRVVNSDEADCPVGEPGEVWISGPHVMKEYWNRPEATAETLVDGWLRTGDVGTLDDEGFLYIEDRIKDMVISGGENVYPAEIENIILAHEEVAEVAVIGQPSEQWGESPLAVIVRKGDKLTEKDVLDFCQGKLARFKQPKGIVFVEQIPRNPSGKVLKRILREQFPGPAPV
jgi:O-succinylbenzoate-CoA ligase